MLVTGNGGVQVRGTYGRGLFAPGADPARARSAAASTRPIAAGAQFQDGVRVDGADGRRERRPRRPCAAPCCAAPAARRPRGCACRRRSRSPPTAADRRWPSRSAWPAIRRRRAAGRSAPTSRASTGLDTVGEMHVRGAALHRRRAARRDGLANVCLVTPRARGLRRSGARCSSGTSPPIRVLGPRAARRPPRDGAVDPRAARGRRARAPACPACCSPATPPASSIR